MPAALLVALASVGGIAVIVAILAGLARFAVPYWGAKLDEKDLEFIRKSLDGAITIAEPVIRMTPTNIDDAFLDGVVKVVRDEFRRVRGRAPRVDVATIKDIAKAKTIKAMAAPSGAPVGVSLKAAR